MSEQIPYLGFNPLAITAAQTAANDAQAAADAAQAAADAAAGTVPGVQADADAAQAAADAAQASADAAQNAADDAQTAADAAQADADTAQTTATAAQTDATTALTLVGLISVPRTDLLQSALEMISPATPAENWINTVGIEANTTPIGVANRLSMYPFIPSRDIIISAVGIEVTTAIASAQCKIIAYNANQTTGRPTSRIFETGNLTASTTTDDGTKRSSQSLTFIADTLYWIGTRHSSTANLRGFAADNCLHWSRGTLAGAGNFNCLQTTLTYATAAPATWTWNSADQVRTNNYHVKLLEI